MSDKAPRMTWKKGFYGSVRLQKVWRVATCRPKGKAKPGKILVCEASFAAAAAAASDHLASTAAAAAAADAAAAASSSTPQQ